MNIAALCCQSLTSHVFSNTWPVLSAIDLFSLRVIKEGASQKLTGFCLQRSKPPRDAQVHWHLVRLPVEEGPSHSQRHHQQRAVQGGARGCAVDGWRHVRDIQRWASSR
jgi:hypothetical protein